MATTTLGGNPVQTNSDLPATGSTAPDFLLIGTDLSEKTLAELRREEKDPHDQPELRHARSAKPRRARSTSARPSLADVVVLVVSA